MPSHRSPLRRGLELGIVPAQPRLEAERKVARRSFPIDDDIS